VRTQATEQNYDVTGASVEEIARSLEERATAALGPEVAGRHEWDVRWNYRYAPRGSACQITELTMELNSVIILPVWQERESADPTVTALWDQYITELRAHEYGHRVLSYRATREVHRELTRLRVAECSLMPDRAREVGQSILARYKEENRTFDADPANRVIWPPPPASP
jgi:predicted secreted Zn-dependent protease